MSKENNDRDDDKSGFGYGRPPVASQFKPGTSGNPRGRPRGSKNRPRMVDLEPLRAILTKEAYRPVKVRDGERNITIPVVQAIVRTMAIAALKGNHRSQSHFLDALTFKEKEDGDRRYRSIDAAFDYKNYWKAELDRRKKLGITGPEPDPHPDHVVIDYETERVVIRGPMPEEDKLFWENLKQILKEKKQGISDLERMTDKNPNDKYFANELMKEKRRYDKVMNVIPESYRHLVEEK